MATITVKGVSKDVGKISTVHLEALLVGFMKAISLSEILIAMEYDINSILSKSEGMTIGECLKRDKSAVAEIKAELKRRSNAN